MPTTVTRDPGTLPGLLSLAAIAFGVVFLTILPGGVCWLTLGQAWGLVAGGSGMALACSVALIAVGPMLEPDTPACAMRNCPCACHDGDGGDRR